VNTLFDPLTKGEFWRQNWKEILLFAVNFIPFGKGGSIASRIAGKLGLDKGITGAIVKGLEDTVDRLGRAIIDFVAFIGRKFAEGFSKALGIDNAVATFGRRLVLRFATIGVDLGSGVAGWFGRMAVAFGEAVGKAAVWIGSGIAKVIGFITAPFRAAFNLIAEPITFIFKLWADEFLRGVNLALGWGRSIVGGLFRGLGSVIRTLVTPVRQGLTLILQDLSAWPGKFYAKGAAAVRWLGQGIKTAASRFGGLLNQAGQQLVQGLINGWDSTVDTIRRRVTGFANWVKSTLAHIWDTHSPSRMTQWFGKMLGLGLVAGIDGSLSKVRASSQRLGAAGLVGTTTAGAQSLATPQLAVAAPAAAGAGALSVSLDPTSANAAASPLARALLVALRDIVRIEYQGDVRRALSQPGR